MKVLPRYLLMQIPGWMLVAVGLWLVWPSTGLAAWIAPAVFVAWVIKDLAIFPLVRGSYGSRVDTGASRLIGERGVARESLDPLGYIEIRGELWRARGPADRPLSPGSRVEVTAVNGLELSVVHLDEDEHAS